MSRFLSGFRTETRLGFVSTPFSLPQNLACIVISAIKSTDNIVPGLSHFFNNCWTKICSGLFYWVAQSRRTRAGVQFSIAINL